MSSKKVIIVEGLIFIIISIVAAIEALRLVFYKDPQTLYDTLGPGWYLFSISVFIFITAFFYSFVNLRYIKENSEATVKADAEKVETGKEGRKVLLGTIGAFGLYVLALDYLGYSVATFIFLLCTYWLIGVKRWVTNVVLTFAVTVVYWGVFIKYGGMVFPKGIFGF